MSIERLRNVADQINLPITKHLDNLYHATKKNKSELIQMLGLDDTNLRTTLPAAPLDPATIHPHLMRYLREALWPLLASPFGSPLDLVDWNALTIKATGQKLTRYLSKHVQSTPVPEDVLSLLQQAKRDKPTTQADFLPRLGEFLNAQRLQLTISAHPADILTASYNSGYTSCHSPGSAHFNGNIAYSLDDHTLVAYTHNYGSDRKTGRAFVYSGKPTDRLTEAQKAHVDHVLWWCVSRLYGSMTPDHASEVRHVIQERVAAYYGLENKWLRMRTDKVPGVFVVDNYGAAYIDRSHFDLFYHSALAPRESMRALVVIPAATCIACGEKIGEGEDGVCDGCSTDRLTCSDCGCRVPEDEARYCADEAICASCYDNYYFTCSYCGDVAHSDRGRYLENLDQHVCDYCLRGHYTRCEDCDEIVNRDYVSYLENLDQHVCDCCLREHYTRCDDCDEMYRDEDIDRTTIVTSTGRTAEKNLCRSCLENYTECEKCGAFTEYADEVTIVTGTGHSDVTLCPRCRDSFDECPECGESRSQDWGVTTCPECGYTEKEEEEQEVSNG